MNRSKSLASKKAANSSHADLIKKQPKQKQSGFNIGGFDFAPTHTNDLDEILAVEHKNEMAKKEREAKEKQAKN